MFKSTVQSWLVCLVFIILFALWDYFTRLNSTTVDTQSNTIAALPISRVEPTLNKVLKDKILVLYARYDLPPKPMAVVPVVAPVIKKGLSLAEQNEQRGELGKFYLGDYSYTPLGVFKGKTAEQNEIFAVLIQQHVDTNNSQEIKVVLNQLLPPYRVSNITETMIEFSADNRVIQLSLFKR